MTKIKIFIFSAFFVPNVVSAQLLTDGTKANLKLIKSGLFKLSIIIICIVILAHLIKPIKSEKLKRILTITLITISIPLVVILFIFLLFLI